MLNRRHLLPAGAALATASTSRAAAPLARAQAPGFQRLRVGRVEMTAVADGHIPLAPEMFGADAATVASVAAQSVQPHPLRGHVNAYAVNTGERLILVDTGGPASFAPTMGQFPAVFAAAGFAPAQVDTILLTHLHIDHIGGLVDADGRAVFAGAELVLAEAEHAFWSDPGLLSRVPAQVRPLVEAAQATLAAYAGRVRRFEGAVEVVAGINAVPLPGHTPGHTGYLVADGGASVLIWGDIVHAPVVQFERPAVAIAFDTDPAAARATRMAIMRRVVAERQMIAGMHLPFPGFGHVEARGEGFAFAPLWWRHDLG